MEPLEGEFDEVPQIINTSEHHMALVFLLDTSGSMSGKPINSLSEGLNRFKSEVCEDKQTRDILDVAIIEFNSKHKLVQEFCPIEYMEPVELRATGLTNMAPAIQEALDMVDERSRLYKRTGTAPYKPWIMLISDGAPTDDITSVIARVKEMEADEKVSFRSLGVGLYDPETLHQLCGEKVLKLEGTDFTTFFNWMNKSMRSVSRSTPGVRAKPVPLEKHLSIDILPNWDVSPGTPSVSPSTSSERAKPVSFPDSSADTLPDWDLSSSAPSVSPSTSSARAKPPSLGSDLSIDVLPDWD